MTVKRLIESLQRCEPEAIVFFENVDTLIGVEMVIRQDDNTVKLLTLDDYREDDDAFFEDEFYENGENE